MSSRRQRRTSIASHEDEDDEALRRNDRRQQLLNSPQKSQSSCVSSASASEEDDDEVIELDFVAHKNLLEPPPISNIGLKPKQLTVAQKGKEIPLPKCCEGKAANHKKCADALHKANAQVNTLQNLAEEQNNNNINTYNNYERKVRDLEKFISNQYTKARNLVVERNDLLDQVRQLEVAKNEQVKLERKITNLKNDLDKKDEEIGKLKKNSSHVKSPKITKKKGIDKNDALSQIELEQARLQMRHEFKIKEAEQKDKIEQKREERKDRQKDSRNRSGLNLMGQSGLINGRGGLIDFLVSSDLEFCMCMFFFLTHIINTLKCTERIHGQAEYQ